MRTVQEPVHQDIAAQLGMRVRHRRWILGIPQADLAKGIGMSLEALQAFERGEHRIGLVELWKMAEMLEVSVSYIVCEDGDGPDPDPFITLCRIPIGKETASPVAAAISACETEVRVMAA